MVGQGYAVVDAHCHVYPEKIAARAVESTDHFYDTHAFGQGTVTDLLTVGKAAGCDGYVIQSVASTPHHVESINRFIAAALAISVITAFYLLFLNDNPWQLFLLLIPVAPMVYLAFRIKK